MLPGLFLFKKNPAALTFSPSTTTLSSGVRPKTQSCHSGGIFLSTWYRANLKADSSAQKDSYRMTS
jgi:hypothetical protein